MIDCLIFSKDRACQLDLLLRSIHDNFAELSCIYILYTASNYDFNTGYELLIKKFPKLNWVRETDLVADIKNIITSFKEEFSLTLVDDEVVIRNQPIQPMLDIMHSDNSIHCASLRVGRNINFTYSSDIASPPPDFEIFPNGILKWDWRECRGDDWNFIACINSQIYRTKILQELIVDNDFTSVNNIENAILRKTKSFPDGMICFDWPKTINIANNLVQCDYYSKNRGTHEYAPLTLNAKFLSGYEIETGNIYGYITNSAIVEIDYSWSECVS